MNEKVVELDDSQVCVRDVVLKVALLFGIAIAFVVVVTAMGMPILIGFGPLLFTALIFKLDM